MVKKSFRVNQKFGVKIFWKKNWVKKMVIKKIWDKNKIWGPQNIRVKNFWNKKFEVKQIGVDNKFRVKKLVSKFRVENI